MRGSAAANPGAAPRCDETAVTGTISSSVRSVRDVIDEELAYYRTARTTGR
jgi:hypothetical protein